MSLSKSLLRIGNKVVTTNTSKSLTSALFIFRPISNNQQQTNGSKNQQQRNALLISFAIVGLGSSIAYLINTNSDLFEQWKKKFVPVLHAKEAKDEKEIKDDKEIKEEEIAQKPVFILIINRYISNDF